MRTNQMSFGDYLPGFEFDASEPFRPGTNPSKAFGRLVQAALEANKEAIDAYLTAWRQSPHRENVRPFLTETIKKDGTVDATHGFMTPLGAFMIALANESPADPMGAFKKRLKTALQTASPLERQQALQDLLLHGRQSRQLHSVQKTLTLAVQFHPDPTLAIESLIKCKSWPKLKSSTMDVIQPALLEAFQNLSPKQTQDLFKKNGLSMLPIFFKTGLHQKETLHSTAEHMTLQAFLSDHKALHPHQNQPLPGLNKTVEQLVEHHGNQKGPLDAEVLKALVEHVKNGNVERLMAAKSLVSKAAQAGQFIFLKAKEGDEKTLQTMIDMKAHLSPDGTNLATAMMCRHLRSNGLNPDHLPALMALIKAGGNPSATFSMSANPEEKTSLALLLQKNKQPVWRDLKQILKAQQAQDAIRFQEKKKPSTKHNLLHAT